jgi:hypothetical protein
VSWNRYGHYDAWCREVEVAGGKSIIAENGYLGRDEEGRQMYALALSGHNGSGTFPVGGPERWAKLVIRIQPWRRGNKIVIRGQRGIGTREMASPPHWHTEMAAKLAKMTRRPLQVVPHPGEGAERCTAHEDYLQDAHALVIWSSSVGVKALVMGVPVFRCAPHWICEGAAEAGVDAIESPKRDDDARLQALERMAWAQWSLAEIESGEPFRRLLA